MAELKYAKDLQTRFDKLQKQMLGSQAQQRYARFQVSLFQRIDALMGDVATWKEKFESMLRINDANLESYNNCAKQTAALEEKIARLENKRDAILEAVTQICPAFEIQSITARVLAARAATPATGAEQVHAPKTIVPEPDQRRIETERIPKKGGE